MSVRPSVRKEQLDSQWTGFREILYLGNFRKSVEKIQFHENPTRITSTLQEEKYTFLSYLAQSS